MKRIKFKIEKLVLLIIIVMFVHIVIKGYDYAMAKIIKYEKYDYFEGYGTFDSPYLIENGEDLEKFSELVNSGNKYVGQYFRLTADIDMSGISMNPIGKYENGQYFFGTLDGNGHCISNLYINTGGYDGLFGKLGGTVINLGIESGFIGNLDFKGCCGAIASNSVGSSARIINCFNKATVGGYRAGGIADNFLGSIINCWSDCELVGTEIGGITAYASSLGPQTFCYTTSVLTEDGSGHCFNCYTIKREELYSNSMARRLSGNCLIWFETMTPVRMLNEWSFYDDELRLSSTRITYWNLFNFFVVVVLCIEYYTWISLIGLVLFMSIALNICLKRARTKKILS
ncbi:hypothetical protein [Pseudobutyrivibrio sp.]|uniref:hypothetical protein n=1 Tax=Pseudobutyrivibrio sp. TaxID=2014367 RepID=UPI001D5DF80A|nr:hypothetical protein [Pseudobutyrivibrio sp.]MBE5910034.1 hypothetical protein [Pseudobutyrivibrio sp.]